MSPSLKFVDTIHNTREETRKLASRIDRLAGAFITTGNEIVADKLYKISGDLEAIVERLYESFEDMQNSNFKQAQENTANVLTALTAGLELGRIK